MTVGELAQRMSCAEFAGWIAYSRVEPFGERRADQRAWLGVAAATALAGETIEKAFEGLAPILPDWAEPREADPEDAAAQLDSFFRQKIAADAARGVI